MIQIIKNYSQLVTETNHLKGPLILGFFGDFSQGAKDTLPAFKAFCEKHPQWPAYLVDVGKTRDVHGRFAVAEVPAVILVRQGRVEQRVVGTATVATYEHALAGGPAAPQAARPAAAGTPALKGTPAATARPARSVTVFTTQSCSWCVRVKNYLRQNNVAFKEVDVGRDQRAAMELVRRTGQQGVPQLDINGSYVVGFDKAKIDRLLGLSGAASAMN
ncbi:thioredoxin family protein [Myxococcota bacterium]|nr:thioredoxin family protein [Myxococcota bacterium]MBU1411922.1 thioredoxin family protein [Myxococcota bacterium]MBU1509606.1 thioredoxin family protein [Myxococcota bacterium]